METKDTQTVARHGAATTAPTGEVDGKTPPPAQVGDGPRRRDDITRRVPNPLLVHQKTPPPAQAAPAKVEPVSPHTSPTAKLKVSSLVWNEYSSMPQTPAPVLPGQALENHPDSPVSHKSRRGLTITLAIVIISAGALAGALIPRGKTGSQGGPPRETEPKATVPGTPETALDVPKAPVAAAASPAPSRPSKRHVSIAVEPAEASILLDGIVVGSHTIALDLMQDRATHVAQVTAHGYLPFKKTFTLESDVNLRISLRKAAAPALGGRPKAQPLAPVAKPLDTEPSVKPRVEPASVKPNAEPREDFGMDLNRPTVRRQTKKMDEKDPYSP